MRCQGYTDKGTKCHTRVKDDSIYCCDKHKPKNYDDVIEECNICCSELENEDIKILKCGHAHHRSCLEAWMNVCRDKIVGCPLCRAPIGWIRKKNDGKMIDNNV